MPSASPRWWEIRRAHNRKPTTYRCPLCGELLPALSEHMLIVPEGDASRRRHAHSACVMNARRAGRLPTKGEFEKGSQPRRAGRLPTKGEFEKGSQPRRAGALARLRKRFSRDT
ncbi:MAG: hypothetical protein ACLP0J_07135 [Solirubrobacteraceae bacterium]